MCLRLSGNAALYMNNIKLLAVCKPYMLVGTACSKSYACGIGFLHIIAVKDISVIAVIIKIGFAYGIGRIVFKRGFAVNGEIFRRFNLLCKARRFNNNSVFVNRLAISVYKVPVNKNIAAADNNLRLSEFLFSVFSLIILIAEGCLFVGKELFALLNLYAVPYGDLIFNGGVVALVYIADLPFKGAGLRIIADFALAVINIRFASVISGLIGGKFRLPAKYKLNLFAHNIAYLAVLCGDGDASRNFFKCGFQLARNIGFIIRNGKIALCGVAGAGFKHLFALRTRLQSNGVDGSARRFCPVCFPNGSFTKVVYGFLCGKCRRKVNRSGGLACYGTGGIICAVGIICIYNIVPSRRGKSRMAAAPAAFNPVVVKISL